ncbi:hypothetical protein JOF56_004504 [Kibdelosporangium banguiense]|uniref:Uncharacterized protein n=1 Tax=Kibdelosporangium banguiense TaxID=1365924 RepID=A0ABS4TII5_9PSEU|nr:hypothetical protein [Kibdelosporangium banguiense]MBP2324119.1 hypothetical protein [Kibdelosporangium banguiense]
MVVRLRPVVHASPTPDGIHVRGWASSFTLQGGKGLWTIWQRIAASLATGIPNSEFRVPNTASPAVAKAIQMIIDQLQAHDMVVTVDSEWIPDAPPDEVADWLISVAPQPQESWLRLRAATFTVVGSGLLAAAARRALESTGLEARSEPGDGLIVVTDEHAVAAGCSDQVGYVVHPGSYEDAVSDGKDVARRLGVDESQPPEILAALVGSVAAHRLICAAGGLPDPSTEFIVHPGDDLPPQVPHLGVLVARLDPLTAMYHPWLSATRPRQPDLDALVDPELGPIAIPETGSLPQLPAKIAVCEGHLGIGTTSDAARLDATVRALNTGIDDTHTHGIILRATVRGQLPDFPATEVSEEDWAGDPTARRWWKALTLRFGVTASLCVTRLADHAVHAEIRSFDQVLAWAIEAEAADAVAFAALAATGVQQAREAGLSFSDEPCHLNGAAPLAKPPETSWATKDWFWPADVRSREDQLQLALSTLLDAR